MKKSLAFTLAEVLITLGIIGIVAEMTIPTIVHDVTKQQYVISLKKAYNSFGQVLTLIDTEAGCVGDLTCAGIFGAGQEQYTGDTIAQHFKVVRNCGKSATDTSCASTSQNPKYDGTGVNGNYNGDGTFYRFVTADGIAYAIYNYNNSCGFTRSNGTLNVLTHTCGHVIIDVNAAKKPNRFGRDIFDIYITNDHGLYPLGGMDDGGFAWWGPPANPASCAIPATNPGFGWYCAGRVIEEGWQMNY